MKHNNYFIKKNLISKLSCIFFTLILIISSCTSSSLEVDKNIYKDLQEYYKAEDVNATFNSKLSSNKGSNKFLTIELKYKEMPSDNFEFFSNGIAKFIYDRLTDEGKLKIDYFNIIIKVQDNEYSRSVFVSDLKNNLIYLPYTESVIKDINALTFENIVNNCSEKYFNESDKEQIEKDFIKIDSICGKVVYTKLIGFVSARVNDVEVFECWYYRNHADGASNCFIYIDRDSKKIVGITLH